MQILPQSNITLCTYQAKSSCLAHQFTEWAMRFEAKHQYFKHIPCVSKIFKNLPKTLSERHQSGVCSDSKSLSVDGNASDDHLFPREVKCGSAKVLEGDDMKEVLNMVKAFYPF